MVLQTIEVMIQLVALFSCVSSFLTEPSDNMFEGDGLYSRSAIF